MRAERLAPAAGPRATASDSVRLAELVRSRRARGEPTLWLAGSGWQGGPLAALEARTVLAWRAAHDSEMFLAELDRWVAKRRCEGGSGGTGLAVLLDFEALEPDSRSSAGGGARAIVLAVDASLRAGEGPIERPAAPEPGRPARASSSPVTSLPRDAYLAAVERVRGHIAQGDIYQANLCQQFVVSYEGDPFETWQALASNQPAPHAAWFEAEGLAIASLSPETFLTSGRDGWVETRPIKGTRPRGATPAADRAAAADLLASPKDAAELGMIVDLERNDLSRVCQPGTVEVPEAATLHSFPAVHHLIARVRGRLRHGSRPSDLLRATFPGGSISGAPKRRAIEILRALEPVPRGFFTGSLLWFDDDGTLDSSLLIRTLVLEAGQARLGAGGGIVADSDPEAEWRESNHKARALAAALGFAPEEAS